MTAARCASSSGPGSTTTAGWSRVRAEHVGVGALEGHRAGVVGPDQARPARQRRHRLVHQQLAARRRRAPAAAAPASPRAARRAPRRRCRTPSSSRSDSIVGGSIASPPASCCATAAATGSHTVSSASPLTSRGRWPVGTAATKNRVSNRLGSNSGVIQCAHGRSRSLRSTRAAGGQHLGHRSAAVQQGQPVALEVVAGRVGDHAVGVRPGQQHARLLERLPDGRADQRPGQRLVAAEPAGPASRGGPGPRRVGLAVPGVDRAAREDVHPGGERHRARRAAAGRPPGRRRRRAAAPPSPRAAGAATSAASPASRKARARSTSDGGTSTIRAS